MRFPRAAGILLHISSLPGRQGIGDFGPEAYRFVDFLERAGQSLWQILPLGPTGYGNSPYQSLSAFAGNPLFVSLEMLADQGLLPRDVPEDSPKFSTSEVEFDAVTKWHRHCLSLAFERFAANASKATEAEFLQFRAEQGWWLDDYLLFIALKESHDDLQWTLWPTDLVERRPAALQAARHTLNRRMELEAFIQFQFVRQWAALKNYAHQQHVRLIGDIPIFVAHDSADVWANQDMFFLDSAGNPTSVAGVPPDYFSETGQLWGNPLYRWDLLAERDYDWWIKRFAHAFNMYDLVRLDHFRGFEAYWEIPGDATDAITGRWMLGPGDALFRVAREKLGELPLIAEDLGVITAPVEALREQLGAPGMRVLQFAFGNDSKASDYQPHNYPFHCVVYTGTHDNDTTVGWFRSEAGEGTTRSETEIRQERALALEYLNTDGHEIAWDMLRLAWASVADTAIAPLQDVLELGSEARMNLPGTARGNWTWRYDAAALNPQVEARLRRLTELYQRIPTRPSSTMLGSTELAEVRPEGGSPRHGIEAGAR